MTSDGRLRKIDARSLSGLVPVVIVFGPRHVALADDVQLHCDVAWKPCRGVPLPVYVLRVP